MGVPREFTIPPPFISRVRSREDDDDGREERWRGSRVELSAEHRAYLRRPALRLVRRGRGGRTGGQQPAPIGHKNQVPLGQVPQQQQQTQGLQQDNNNNNNRAAALLRPQRLSNTPGQAFVDAQHQAQMAAVAAPPAGGRDGTAGAGGESYTLPTPERTHASPALPRLKSDVAGTVRRALAHLPTMIGSTEGTVNRRNRVRETVGLVLAEAPTRPAAVLGVWRELDLAMSTIETYGFVAQSLFPDFRKNHEWVESMKWVMQEAARTIKAQAVALRWWHVRQIAAECSPEVQATIFTLVVTASRYGDLQHMRVSKIWDVPEQADQVIIRIEMPTFKSDLHGRRSFAKTIQVSRTSARFILSTIHHPMCYGELYLAMEPMGVTPHSCRVGAVTALGPLVPAGQVLLLTGHTVEGEPRQQRRYTRATGDDDEARLQREMSLMLEQWYKSGCRR